MPGPKDGHERIRPAQPPGTASRRSPRRRRWRTRQEEQREPHAAVLGVEATASSDSASIRSNGVRFVSAMPEIKKMMKAMKPQGEDEPPVRMPSQRVGSPAPPRSRRATSCPPASPAPAPPARPGSRSSPACRRAHPAQQRVLFRPQPGHHHADGRQAPHREQEQHADVQIGRTTPGDHGITAQAISAAASTTIGERPDDLVHPAGTMSSLESSLIASATVCSSPNGPTRSGRRSCILAMILRSIQTSRITAPETIVASRPAR